MPEADLPPIQATPTKRFFVHMLTRDIELQDAILDMIDNCVDGIIRKIHSKDVNPALPYRGFSADINMSPQGFEIRDNCGGIPRDVVARAFKMGRPEGPGDVGQTVGMYGIGMKRAIFKMGTSCKVASRSDDFGFVVTISPEWMEDPDEWKLPITHLPEDDELRDGTRITIDLLREDVALRFNEKDDNFIQDFKEALASHYALIIAKGFKVGINGEDIQPKRFALLVGEDLSSANTSDVISGRALEPYVFKGRVGSVDIEIYAGLYRPLPDEAEMEREEEIRSSKDDAGWTIVCNDRIVVYRDKTRLTGWGEADVPNFHGQFIAFSGVVIMKSDEPLELPLTTTKRGIDASSNLYSIVKDYMREATKAFTNFTNKWKRLPAERDRIYSSSRALGIEDLRSTSATYRMSDDRKIQGAVKYMPSLPVPKAPDRGVFISYRRPRSDIQKVSKILFDDPDLEPRVVGEETFDRILRQPAS
ncbi:ATP-binding protein [Methylobacterium nodulans]|uniref:ATP-binding region ATPase domain protein n=1 Tax=Methylobacterium nodulans (strain LMG 21967 / CNCM I-2342 / ORS 2060) TaxID=460265 RepID=B8IIG3_METNO|nr:ATP-binding protein [Methylobacterium nodulans]ACL59840.1 conserved hypothetical protein [Methylobacterium nodulans ORS 2060]